MKASSSGPAVAIAPPLDHAPAVDDEDLQVCGIPELDQG